MGQVVERIEQAAEAQVTWRAAFSQSLLTVIVPVMGYLDFPSARPEVMGSRLLAVASGIVLLVLLARDRRRPGLKRSLVAFSLAPLPLFIMFWFTILERAARGLPVEIFLRANVASIIYAVLAPPAVTVSLIIIGLFTAQNLILFFVTPETPLAIMTNQQQPYTSIFVGLCAIGIALYRARRQRTEVRMIVAHEQANSVARLARSFLAVRDLANTPLQTLEVSLALLSSTYPVAQELTGRMSRSLRRMRELNQILSTQRSELGWDSMGESFDPVEILSSRTDDGVLGGPRGERREAG
jgi:hypothetical protein